MIATGFTGLDNLTGGLEQHKNYLLYGNIGTGKTTFSLQCLYQGLINGETVAIVSRRSASTVFDQGHAFGMDLEAFARDGQFIVMEYNPHVIENSMRLKEPEGITREFEFLLEGDRVQRLVFDPIAPVLASPGESLSIFRARSLIQYFASLNATCLYLFDTPEGEEYLGNCKDFVYGVLRFEAGAFPGAGRMSLERFPSLRGRQAQLDFEVSPGVGMIELAAAAGAEGAGPRKVLIIEPEAAERETLRSVLGKTYNLLEADSAADGLAKIAADSPDLVLLARDLKGMDGVEICRKLRQNKMNVPVILISKQVRRAHDRVEMMSAGADECLERPLDGRILRLKVQNLLRRYEGQRDRFVAGPLESTVSSAIERDKTTSTNNLAYFYDRVRQEVNYANENALSFAVLVVRMADGGGTPQEVAGLAGALIREYDLVFTDKSGVAVLLAETEEKGVSAFLNRFKEKWTRTPAPQVEFKLYNRQEDFLQTARGLLEGVRGAKQPPTTGGTATRV